MFVVNVVISVLLVEELEVTCVLLVEELEITCDK